MRNSVKDLCVGIISSLIAGQLQVTLPAVWQYWQNIYSEISTQIRCKTIYDKTKDLEINGLNYRGTVCNAQNHQEFHQADPPQETVKNYSAGINSSNTI